MNQTEDTETKYWLVGASWGGTDHQDEAFVSKRMWMLGWEEGSQHQKASQITAGDRIAIKRLLGQGQTGIRILHIGIVRGVILDTDKIVCTVDWVVTHLDRVIGESKGCFKSVHGPYLKSDSSSKQWIEEIFCL
jgi:hypothetical protein